MRQTSTTPHPLEPMVLAAFAEREHHDAASLSYFLAGGIAHRGSKAYHTVALDVLGYMENQGKLSRDSLGWYRLKRYGNTRGVNGPAIIGNT